jgi:hypothetical protein
MLIEQKGIEAFDRFANYGVVSESLYCASLLQGVRRMPKVAAVGIDYDSFFSDIPSSLRTVGYASSMSVTTYGVEWKRGELAKAAAEDAGLPFKVAGSTANQISFHDMPDFYRSVDAVVVSSISEAAQLPVMEAAAAGRLVIGTPVGHFPRKAYEGGGIIAPVEADKFRKFVAATLRFYKENPAAYVEKCRSIQEVARQFDWQYSVDGWIELIETASAGKELPGKAETTSQRDGANSAGVKTAPSPPSDGEQIHAAHSKQAASRGGRSVLDRLDLAKASKFVQRIGQAQPTDLCRLMASFGSDKGGPYHNYTILYEHLFAEFRAERLAVFELGLGTNKVDAPSTMGASGTPGASLRAWRSYFRAATIYGADVDRDILFDDDRIRTYWVDQRDSSAIRQLWNQVGSESFDIIIDDGLHEASANINFFVNSVDKLKSGGIYFIEDIRPEDVQRMQAFVDSIGSSSRTALFPLLDHPKNKGDNRLVIIQKI